MYNYFPQYPQFNVPNYQQNIPKFITYQVSTIEEAKSFLIEPMNVYLFVDTNAGKIYMKRMNNNGLSEFYTFSVVESREENKTDPLQEIKNKLNDIENKIGGFYESISKFNSGKGKSNHESDRESDVPTGSKAESATFPERAENDERKK
jgi:hypothetical protein